MIINVDNKFTYFLKCGRLVNFEVLSTNIPLRSVSFEDGFSETANNYLFDRQIISFI